MKKLCIIFSLVLSLLLVSSVHADIGPKPTVNIYVKYEGQPLQDNLFYAKMLACINADSGNYQDEIEICKMDPENPRCKYATKLSNISIFDSHKNCFWRPAFLAWGGDCSSSKCKFWYMPPQNFKFAVYIPSLNKTFISNDITRTNLNSEYEANLNQDGTAHIKETTSVFQTSSFVSFIAAFILTLIIELFFGLIYISAKKLKKNPIIVLVVFANIISLPIVWFIFPLFTANLISAILIGEIFAVFFEAFIYYRFDRKDFPLFRKAIKLSIILNAASFFLGGIIFVFLSFSMLIPIL